MSREEITSIVYVNGNNKPQSLKFSGWIVETKHYKQMPRKLNDIREIAGHILKSSGLEFISLNHKTLK